MDRKIWWIWGGCAWKILYLCRWISRVSCSLEARSRLFRIYLLNPEYYFSSNINDLLAFTSNPIDSFVHNSTPSRSGYVSFKPMPCRVTASARVSLWQRTFLDGLSSIDTRLNSDLLVTFTNSYSAKTASQKFGFLFHSGCSFSDEDLITTYKTQLYN